MLADTEWEHWPFCKRSGDVLQKYEVRPLVEVNVLSFLQCFDVVKSSAVAEMGDHSAIIDMGGKVGEGCCAHFRGGAVSPSNTMSPWSRATSVPSGILIHKAVWPQQSRAKNWGLCAFWGELGPHLTQCGLGRGLPP